MATLLIVVYSVSIIAAVTELSIDRYHEDEINLNQILNEYIYEMNYQLEKSLFKYIINTTANEDTILIDLENFHSIFSDYTVLKGIKSSLTIKPSEFEIFATKNSSAPTELNLSTDFSKTIYVKLNTSIVFQSVNSASTISGILIHYFGINAFVSSVNQDILTFKQVDRNGETIKYITGISITLFISPLTPSDKGNGDYFIAGSYDAFGIFATLPSGIDFLS